MNAYDWMRYALNFFEMLACVVGFICWKKIKNTYWKWFPVYLLAIVVTELTAKYSYALGYQQFNVDIYRFFGIPIQFLFFVWLFYQYFTSLKEKILPLTGAAIYLLAWITDLAFFDDFKFWFQSFSYTIGNIVLLVLIINFYLKFVNSNEILTYRSSMMFWVCLGLLIFYLGSLPFYGLYNTLRDIKKYPNVLNIYWLVQMCFNYLMYLFFVIAFIWGKPRS